MQTLSYDLFCPQYLEQGLPNSRGIVLLLGILSMNICAVLNDGVLLEPLLINQDLHTIGTPYMFVE